MAYDYFQIFDFRGGMNDSASPDNLLDNEMQLAVNIDLSLRGGFQRRKGITEHKNLGEYRIDRLIEFEYLDSGTGQLMRKQLALTNGELIDLETSTSLYTGLDNDLDYEVYKDKVYILSNGKYLVYDGSTVTDVTCSETDSNLDTIKKCRYIEQRGERLFASGNPDDPNILYFSEVGRPEYWKTTNIIKAVTDDGDRITGLKEFHGALLVFKTRSIYAWFGYDPLTDVSFDRLSVHTGTKAYRTIQYVGNYLFFLGEDGVYALVGTYKDVISTVPIANNIKNLINTIKHEEPYYSNTPCAVFHEGKYMLSVATGNDASVNDTILVFFYDIFDSNPEFKPWVVYKGWNVSDFLKSYDGVLYSGSSATGIIHEHDTGYSDLGQAIEVEVILKPIATEAYIHNKKFRRGYIALRQFVEYNSSLDIYCIVDYNEKKIENISPDESLVWDLRNWDEYYWDFTELVTRRFDIKDKGKRLTVKIYDNTVDNVLFVYGLVVEYKIKKPDRR